MTQTQSVLLQEIREQPAALLRLLEHADEYRAVTETARKRGLTLVRMVAHGSSDNAASFGVYAFGILAGWTAMRDSISLSVYYGAEVDMRSSIVLGFSQSGRTPDVVEYLQRARSRGAFTVAVTNETGSELAQAAEAVLPLAAGPERGIAATKTYTNTLAAIALTAAYAGGQGDKYVDGIHRVSEQLEELLPRLERHAPETAVALAFVGRMFVIGRGPEFATAREISLKLLETCRVAAEPLTATDLAHGPVAAVDGLFPVWAIASDEQTLPAVRDAVERARAAGSTVFASGTLAEALTESAYTIPVPTPPQPLLSPLLSVAPGQVLAWALAKAKGLDADRPAGLTKVTLAR